MRHPTVVIAPNSFKGSVSATGAAAAISKGLKRIWSDAELRICPMADGGEGTLDAVLSRGGRRGIRRVEGASGAALDAAFGLIEDDAIAVIESAQIVGLTDASGTAAAVEQRNTRGLGELIRTLLDAGIRRFMIGLGGSSSNDGGAGMLAALGLKLVDAKGRDVEPTPGGLKALAQVDASTLDLRVTEAHITIMSDVSNPLCGERGATPPFSGKRWVACATTVLF